MNTSGIKKITIQKDLVDSEYLKLLEIEIKYLIEGMKNGYLDVILNAPLYKSYLS